MVWLVMKWLCFCVWWRVVFICWLIVVGYVYCSCVVNCWRLKYWMELLLLKVLCVCWCIVLLNWEVMLLLVWYGKIWLWSVMLFGWNFFCNWLCCIRLVLMVMVCCVLRLCWKFWVFWWIGIGVMCWFGFYLLVWCLFLGCLFGIEIYEMIEYGIEN